MLGRVDEVDGSSTGIANLSEELAVVRKPRRFRMNFHQL